VALREIELGLITAKSMEKKAHQHEEIVDFITTDSISNSIIE